MQEPDTLIDSVASGVALGQFQCFRRGIRRRNLPFGEGAGERNSDRAAARPDVSDRKRIG